MRQLRKLTVLLNRGAGRRGANVAKRLSDLFDEAGARLTIHELHPSDFAQLIGREEEAGAATIGVAGGDGSISAAAASLVGTSTALLPLPTGTLNNFSKRIGIRRLEDAVEAFERGETQTVPVGVLDDQIFLNTATLGLYADVVRIRDRLRATLTKWPAAIVAFSFVLLRLQRIEIAVYVEGEYLRRSTPLLWIGLSKNRFSSPDDEQRRDHSPELEIVVLKPGTRINAISIFYRVVSRLIRRDSAIDDPCLEVMHARSVLIYGSHRVGVTLDGEVHRFDPPVYIAVQDDALTVLVPPDPETAETSGRGTTRV